MVSLAIAVIVAKYFTNNFVCLSETVGTEATLLHPSPFCLFFVLTGNAHWLQVDGQQGM